MDNTEPSKEPLDNLPANLIKQISPMKTQSIVGDVNFQPLQKLTQIRKTSTPGNASRFVAVFDLAIDNFGGNDIFIPAAAVMDIRTGRPLKVDTIRHRMSEALAYLGKYDLPATMKGKYSITEYIRLRLATKMSLVSDEHGNEGVSLKFVEGKTGLNVEMDNRLNIANAAVLVPRGASIGKVEVQTNTDGKPLWQQKVEEFIEDGSKQTLLLNGPREIGGLLNSENIEMIKRIFLQNDIECQITSTMIKALR